MKFFSRSLGCLALAALAVGCQNPVNLRNAEKYHDAAGLQAYFGNHLHAAALYSRAVTNAELGNAPTAGLAMVHYNYGHTLCLIGEFDEGVESLERSLELQRKVEPREVAELLRRNAVLGRVKLDTGDPAGALPHFREVHELLPQVEGDPVPPADRLDILRDHRAAAEAAGTAEELAKIDSEIEAIVADHGHVEPKFPYERFTSEAVELRLAADNSPDEFRDD